MIVQKSNEKSNEKMNQKLTEACESGVGSTRASEESRSKLMFAIALVELKRCSLCFNPPKKKQHPSTSSMFEKTDPRSEAWPSGVYQAK